MNRIDAMVARAREEGSSILALGVVACDPFPEATHEHLITLADSGADVLELIIPFSDPAYHGQVIQRACARALKEDTSLEVVCEQIEAFRKASSTPLIVSSYYNRLLCGGLSNSLDRLAAAGVDGVAMHDVCWAESGNLRRELARCGMRYVPAVAPSTATSRIERLEAAGCTLAVWTGHLGNETSDELALLASLERLASATTSLSIIGSMKIEDPASARVVATRGHGILVGSAVAWVIAGRGADLQERLGGLAASMRAGLDA